MMTSNDVMYRIYYATASKYVRPTQVYKVHFELLYMPYRTLEVNAVLIQDNKEYATSTTVFTDIGSRIIELKVALLTLALTDCTKQTPFLCAAKKL